jgi:hypothetical protein
MNYVNGPNSQAPSGNAAGNIVQISRKWLASLACALKSARPIIPRGETA